MEPGASKPKPGGDPSAPMDDAEVERTLTSLESITSTLVQEVGTPPNRAAEAEAQAAATAEQANPATPAATSQAGTAGPPADAQSQAAPAATDGPAQDMPPQGAAAAPAETTGTAQPATGGLQAESSTPIALPDAAQPASGESDPSAAAEPNTGHAAPAMPEPALAKPATSADAEVEQEISQAIQQLQSGRPVAARATTAPAKDASANPSIARRIFRGLTRAVDAPLAPLSLLALLLDLPFRWMPIALKHLLGYVAVGTALMAGALWYYIIAVRPH